MTTNNTSFNPMTGDVEPAYYNRRGTFSDGGYVQNNRDIIKHTDGNWYKYISAIPSQGVAVPANSVPDSNWASVGNGSFNHQLFLPDGFKLAPSLQPKPMFASSVYADRNAGVLPTNTSLENGNIVNSLLAEYDEVILTEAVPLGNVVVSARKIFRSLTRVRLPMDDTVTFGLKVERGSVGSVFSNLVFNCKANNQTAYIQDGQSGNPALSYPQYSNYYNCDAEGDHLNGSVSLLLSYTWSNNWYGCNFNRTVDGIIFARDTDPDGFTNANHFYGCELRSDKTQANSRSPLIHNSGGGNAFIGGAIENWFGSPSVIAGHLVITGGCYLEAMDTTYHVSGGRLVIEGCHDNGPAIIIDADGSSLVYERNVFTASEGVYNNNYPKIQRRGDIDAEVIVSAVKPGRSTSVLIRPGEWRTSGGTWSKTSPRKSKESINYGFSSLSARVGDDQNNVTGTDNSYTIKFNNTTIDSDSGNEFNATVGIFTTGVGGMRNINAGVYLSGVTSGQLCELFVVTSDRKYLIATRRGDGVANTFLSGGVSIPLLNGNTVTLQVVAHGSATNNVSVLRGNAVDGYSYISIVK